MDLALNNLQWLICHKTKPNLSLFFDPAFLRTYWPFFPLPCRIISVGGDGMYSEVMNGLVLRTQKDAGVDHNTPEARMQPCDIPIGIIPAGKAFLSF